MLQCVAGCCNVLQRVAMSRGVVVNVQIYSRRTKGRVQRPHAKGDVVVLQRAVVCFSMLQCFTVYCIMLHCVAVYCSVLQCAVNVWM